MNENYGPTCEQSFAFGNCFHDSCYAVADGYDEDQRYVQYYPAADEL